MVPIWLDMGFENEVLGDRGAPHACGGSRGAADWGAAIGAAAVVSASPTRAPADASGRAAGAPGCATGETGLPWELCGAVVGLSWAAALPWATPGGATGGCAVAGPSGQLDGGWAERCAGPDALGEPAGWATGRRWAPGAGPGGGAASFPAGLRARRSSPVAGRGGGGRGRRERRVDAGGGRGPGLVSPGPAGGAAPCTVRLAGQASSSLGSTSSASATRTSVHSVMFASPASIFCQSRQ